MNIVSVIFNNDIGINRHYAYSNHYINKLSILESDVYDQGLTFSF